MRYTLTSWKEIAQYVGKGVRTVQRWELMLGLPVHRPNARNHGIVLASCEEIDKWLASSTKNGEEDSEAARLRKTLSKLAGENERLRQSLAQLENLRRSEAYLATTSDNSLLFRCLCALEMSTQIRLTLAQTLQLSHNLREMREMERASWRETIGLFQNTVCTISGLAEEAPTLTPSPAEAGSTQQ